MQRMHIQRIMKKNAAKGYEKTKLIQTQFPSRNASGLIDIGALILIAKLINDGFRVGLLKSYYRNVAYGKQITRIELDFAPPDDNGCPAPTATKKNVLRVQAKVFVDASYEGDLMAKAGVSYVVGRESRDTYNESLAGQRNLCVFDISPYIDPEDPASGLLPMIDKEPFAEGAASRHIIAYNFRLQWLGNSAGSTIGAPSHYDAARYELVRRALDMNPSLISWPHANYARKNMN